MTEDIEQEIRELEQEARYELYDWYTRYLCELQAHLLRHGYRMQQSKKDVRLIDIIHLASGKVVYETTWNELRNTPLSKAAWLKVVRQEYYKIAEGLS